jgi:hypothetical protein
LLGLGLLRRRGRQGRNRLEDSSRNSAPENLLDLADHALRAGPAQVIERLHELSAQAVEETQVQVAPRVVGLQRDRALQLPLRLAVDAGLETG